MRKLYLLATIALVFFAGNSFAQKIKETGGSLDVLKGVTRLNIIYEYDDMAVGKKSEKEYIQDKREAYNKKEAGKGDKWAKDWFADRSARYQPAFEEEFNKNGNIQLGIFPGEQYSLVFKTTFTEPGFNVGIERKNPSIDGEVLIVDTHDQSKVLAKFTCEHCPGHAIMGDDFNAGERIQEAYAMAGKALGRYFQKNLK